MFAFDKILPYISHEKCALVIGPDIMRFEDKPMNMYLRDRLYERYKAVVSHYYQQDGLFLFPAEDESVKYEVAQSLREECNRLPSLPDYREEVFKNLARLPFHLIISINPDTFLTDTFTKYGVNHRFSHYRKGDRPSDEVVPPTGAEPLIYNIAGSVLEDESLLLDYDDVFSLISSSLGAAGLPNGLQTALDKIRTYIFIGFPFEKWYTQIMLRILCGKTVYRKYASPHNLNAETFTFLTNQFKIDFWDPKDGDFWEAFTQAALLYKETDPEKSNLPFLRDLPADPLAPEETNIIRFLRNAQFAKAINSLLAFAKGTAFEEEATLCSTRYQTIAQKQSSLDSRDFLVTLNQISDAIAQLARQIAESK